MRFIKPISLAIIALVLCIYTLLAIDTDQYFMINIGWNNCLIEAKMVSYVVAGLGFCLAIFYFFFSEVLYSNRLITTQVILYALLVLVIMLWDSNSFSLKEIVDSKDFNSIGEVKSEYKNVLDKDHAYRVFFWILLSAQTIGLLNLVLGFFKPDKDENS